MEIPHDAIDSHVFLADMVDDPYYPQFLVAKGQEILLDVCRTIESLQPKNLDELYTITHQATEQFNDLDEELSAHDSEIETVARENIASDMLFIANAFGFEADIEELVAPRDW
ncbi:DUF5713 family protein [Corynebacterium freiburgense]|uniref:DUF5713 family protein n=1 Tax=Corynebacterium freiburgense TaxID=556548 RepID=UPI00047912AF|nr:DUF5713 family protein [Corynebacterium freiburgense]WJZ02165.1 hypothetical protein CFREI_04335 [Corynebacterium freiburgense]